MKSNILLLFIMFTINNICYSQNNKRDIIISSQLSKSDLKLASTDEILEKCLQYPYINDVMFAEDIPLIFKYIRNEFNGFHELFSVTF
jgi:hypothetical protein